MRTAHDYFTNAFINPILAFTMSLFLLLNTKEGILCAAKNLLVHIDFHNTWN